MQAIKTKLIFCLIFIATVFSAVAFFCFDNALAYAPTFTIIAKNNVYRFSGEELGFYSGRYYLKCLEGVVDGIYYDTLVAPVDATVNFNPINTNPFTFTPEKVGNGIDKQKLIDDINTALYGGKWHVSATFKEIKPQVTVSSLKEFTNHLSSFSTAYNFSTTSRKHNIKLAVDKISGCVLKNGETFSFNNVVGERTEENGFQNAVIIENGQFAEGVGGGVCQVSSTLYNAVLLSGVKVLERHAHSLQSSYVEPSFDAMVSGKVFDLKFINDTGGDLYIKGVANGNEITFTIYGEKPKFTYERLSVSIAEILPEEDEIVIDNDMCIGQTEVVKKAKNGLKSEGYLIVYRDNKRVKTIKLHTDVYKPIRGQVRVGNKATKEDTLDLIDNGSTIS